MIEWVSVFLIGVGLVFYLAGSIGLLRLPDLFCRLHALTKADNLGLGFVAAGLSFQITSLLDLLKLLLIWLLMLSASAAASQLIANWARYGTGAYSDGDRRD